MTVFSEEEVGKVFRIYSCVTRRLLLEISEEWEEARHSLPVAVVFLLGRLWARKHCLGPMFVLVTAAQSFLQPGGE